MREKIRAEIEKSLGNGRIKVLLGPYSKNKTIFLNDELSKISNDMFYVVSGSPNGFLLNFLKTNLKISHKRIFVIDRFTDYDNIVEIINMFEGNKEVDLIVSSNMYLELFLGDNATLIRGRLQYIYFPPFSFEDLSNQSTISEIIEYVKGVDNDLFDGLVGFKYINEAKKICRALINFIGYPLSFRMLYNIANVDVSQNTFISIFNYIAKTGLVHVISRFNLEDNHILPTTFYCFPTDPSLIYQNRDLDEKKWIARLVESLIVYRAIKDAKFVYKAIYRNSDSDDKNALLHTFVVLEGNKHYLLKIHLDGNESSLTNYLSQKYSLQKCVVVLDDIDTYVDDHGVIFIGASTYIRKGL